jgi:transcriptional regulator with XRE-family HTH domain
MSALGSEPLPRGPTPVPGADGAKGTRSAVQRLHRVRFVRRQQGMSLRTAARQLGLGLRETRQQEDETTDLRLSELYRWHRVLDVPLVDLLVDPDTPLSRPVMERARMVRLMKTATAILELAPSSRVRRLAEMLTEQLCELMPELCGVGPWHSVGQRRSLEDVGRIVERSLPDDVLHGSPLDGSEL